MKLKELFAKLTSGYVWGNLLAMVLVVALLIFLTLKGLAVYSKHGEEIMVPQLKGLSYAAAQKKLVNAGLECVVSDSGYVTRYPAGTVLDQSVEAGMKVKPGREVEIGRAHV